MGVLDDTTKTKLCPKCQEVKPAKAFGANPRYKDGLQGFCNKCRSQYPERRLQWQRQYRQSRPEEMRDRYHARYWKDPEKARADQRARRRKLKYEVMAHYSNGVPHCACCGEMQLEFLCIDHINGGGKKHIESIGFGGICRWLRQADYPEGFRVLCFNCNNALAMFGYCPHQNPCVEAI